MKTQTQLAVIGAGPAGLAAAAEAARHGAEVTVFDEAPQVGGRLTLQHYQKPSGDWWIGPRVAEQLRQEAEELGVAIRTSRSVWGVFPGPEFSIKPVGQFGPEDEWTETVSCERLLIATGASERALPLPGWTLPGVLTAGGAQNLINTQGIHIGDRVLIVGPDHLGMLLAMELAAVGSKVVGVALPPPGLMSGDRSSPPDVMTVLAQIAAGAGPNAAIRGLARLAPASVVRRLSRLYPVSGIRVFGAPLLLRQSVVELRGDGRVEEAVLAPLDASGKLTAGRRTIPVDCVCLSGGLSPLIELAASAGCHYVRIPELGGYVPLYGPDFETTLSGVHVAGNATGVESAQAAIEQGRLVGLHIAKQLGELSAYEAPELVSRQSERLAEARRTAIVKLNPEAPKGRKQMQQLWRTYQASRPSREGEPHA